MGKAAKTALAASTPRAVAWATTWSVRPRPHSRIASPPSLNSIAARGRTDIVGAGRSAASCPSSASLASTRGDPACRSSFGEACAAPSPTRGVAVDSATTPDVLRAAGLVGPARGPRAAENGRLDDEAEELCGCRAAAPLAAPSLSRAAAKRGLDPTPSMRMSDGRASSSRTCNFDGMASSAGVCAETRPHKAPPPNAPLASSDCTTASVHAAADGGK